jgi:predicted phosphodiesterase
MRFAVISDIHGNLHALEAVLAEIDRLGLHDIICLGDIVGYGPFPGRCVDLVVKCCAMIVRGNHDDAVINPQRLIEFNGPARESISWTRGVLGPLHLNALCRLPQVVRPHKTVLCIHDSPTRAPTDYVHDAHIAAVAFGGFPEAICLLGHTHVPVIFEARADEVPGPLSPQDVITYTPHPGVPVFLGEGRRQICNPGSVGQPRDADPRASFAVLDLDDRTFTIHRTDYDIDAAQIATVEAGLPTVLAERLAIGA